VSYSLVSEFSFSFTACVWMSYGRGLCSAPGGSGVISDVSEFVTGVLGACVVLL